MEGGMTDLLKFLGQVFSARQMVAFLDAALKPTVSPDFITSFFAGCKLCFALFLLKLILTITISLAKRSNRRRSNV